MRTGDQETITPYRYPASHRALEIAAIATLVGLETWAGARLSSVMEGASVLWVIVAFTLGYVLADFTSGLVHWACDRYGSPQTPVLGPNFIATFRDHHADPKGITRHDFIETNGANCIVCLPVLIPVALWVPVEEAGGSLFIFTLVHALCLWVFATNQFHKWAHQDSPSRLARCLQRLGVAIRPDHHGQHHRRPFDDHYCITSGLLNRPLTGLGFWSRLEAFIETHTGHRAGVDPQGAAELSTETGGR